MFMDDSTIHTDTCTVISVEEYDHDYLDNRDTDTSGHTGIELQRASAEAEAAPFANETSSRIGTPLLRPCTSVPSSVTLNRKQDGTLRSASMPVRRE